MVTGSQDTPSGARPRRILLVRLSHLGDVVHALPVFHALRGAHPRARIGWAVQREFAGLLEGLPGLDEVLDFERRGGARAWLELSEEWPDTRAFVEAVAQRGVVVTGAPAFQVSQVRPRPAVRLSVSAPRAAETLERGLSAIADVLRTPSPAPASIGLPIV